MPLTPKQKQERRARFDREGTCRVCGRPREEGKTVCAYHAQLRRKWLAKARNLPFEEPLLVLPVKPPTPRKSRAKYAAAVQRMLALVEEWRGCARMETVPAVRRVYTACAEELREAFEGDPLAEEAA